MIFPDVMLKNMFSSSNDDEIFNSIISFIPIDMVNYFIRIKRAIKILTHDKAMFRNIAVFVCIWMSVHLGIPITSVVRDPFRSLHSLIPFALCPKYITYCVILQGGYARA